jgi:type IV secretion system protein VirB10
MTLNRTNSGLSDPRGSLDRDALDDAQDNGFPVVAQQFARRDRAGLMLGASIAILLGSATLFAMASSRNKAQVIEPVQQVAVAPAAPYAAQPMPMAAAVPPVAPAMLPAPATPMAAQPMPMINPAMAAQQRAMAPALILDSSMAASPAGNSAPMAVAAPAGVAAPTQMSPAAAARQNLANLSSDELFALRVGGGGDVATASRMTSPATTVSQGTLMTAVLETAINSDLPGYARAVISQDVRSYDRSRVLIPRGSHLIGEYKSGLAVGQTRAYILWTRLLRPDGVSVALASPATDFAGRNGLGGKVNSHFMKRFGSAILLSVIGAAGEALGGGSATVVLAGPQSVINSTAQRDVNIPPTVTVALGQPIRIFTARDLDFSSVSN